MSTGKYILKIFGTHILAATIMVLMMTTMIIIFPNQMWYQVAISFVLASFYWIFMGFSLEKYSLTDVKNKSFNVVKVIIAGLVFIIPDVLFIILDFAVVLEPEAADFFKLLFRYWNAGYLNFIILLKDALWIRLVVTLLYIPGFCIAYYRGPYIVKKTEKTINTMKEEMQGKHIAYDLPPEDDDEN